MPDFGLSCARARVALRLLFRARFGDCLAPILITAHDKSSSAVPPCNILASGVAATHSTRRHFLLGRGQPATPEILRAADMVRSSGGLLRSASSRNFGDNVNSIASNTSPGKHLNIDDDDLSNLAKRVPKVRPSGDTDQDMERHSERDGLVWVIDTLAKNTNSGLVMRVKGFLERELRKASAEVDLQLGQEPPFPHDYKYFNKLPRYWYASWIVENSAGSLDQALRSKIELADGSALRRIFDFATVTNSGHAWPVAALDRDVLSRTFKVRAGEVGNRLHDFRGRGLAPNNTLDWSKCGPYTLLWQVDEKHGHRAHQVKHISGELADIPDEVVITRQFELVNGWCDAGAMVTKAPVAEYNLLHFFTDKHKPPHSLVMEKKASHLRGIAESVAHNLSEARESMKVGVVDADERILDEAVSTKRQEALRKARESFETRQTTKRARTRQVLTT